MMMVLKKDTLSLMDPIDHTLIHCQPIMSIRVWGVGCNNGRSANDIAAHSWYSASQIAVVCLSVRMQFIAGVAFLHPVYFLLVVRPVE